jgi:Zn-dependent M28 family amino/carboxypeptidase
MPVITASRTRAIPRMAAALAATLLLTVSWPGAFVSSSEEGPSTEDRLESISAKDMLATVKDLQDFGSRAFSLDRSKDVADYVYGRFKVLGYDVHYQNFTFSGYSSSNIVAVLSGTDPEAGVVLFGAHHDSENSEATTLELVEALPAPGADDDASGIAAIIELAEAMRDLRVESTLKFVAFGAEERGFDDTGGLRGSLHFVQTEKAAGVAYECAIILDMIGYTDDPENHGTIVTATEDVSFSGLATKAIDDWRLELDLSTLMEPMIAYSDHAPFWAADYPAVLITERLTAYGSSVNPYYHSTHDTVDKLSGGQMENITRCTLAGALAILEPSGHEWLTWESALAIVVIATTALAAILVLRYWRNREDDMR